MNTSSFVLDSSMETLETYETISTTQVMKRKSSLCPSNFRRRFLPNLLDSSRWNNNASMSASSSCSSGGDNSFLDTTFMPWDEYHHRKSLVNRHQTTRTCNSNTCPACRSTTRFVTAATQTAPPPRLLPKWWESPTALTMALADELGEWVESKLSCVSGGDGKEERRFWREMECDGEHDDDASTLPYDEKDHEDQRYASF